MQQKMIALSIKDNIMIVRKSVNVFIQFLVKINFQKMSYLAFLLHANILFHSYLKVCTSVKDLCISNFLSFFVVKRKENVSTHKMLGISKSVFYRDLSKLNIFNVVTTCNIFL